MFLALLPAEHVLKCSLEQFLTRTDLTPLPSLGPCSVAACTRQAGVLKSMVCHAHNCRLVDAKRAIPDLDIDGWKAIQTPIPEGADVSFRGLTELVVPNWSTASSNDASTAPAPHTTGCAASPHGCGNTTSPPWRTSIRSTPGPTASTGSPAAR
ncbi:hypothetical protein ACWEWD_09850 [Streptomyces tendae]